MTPEIAAGSGLLTALIVFLIALAMLWFLLPFAVFGVKPLLRDILATQRAILAALKGHPPSTGPDASPAERFLAGAGDTPASAPEAGAGEGPDAPRGTVGDPRGRPRQRPRGAPTISRGPGGDL